MSGLTFAGYQYNSSTGTRDYCLDITEDGGSVSNTRCRDVRVSEGALTKVGTGNSSYFLIRAGINSGGATSATTLDTAISTSYSIVDKEIASDPLFQTGTLANGVPGQVLTIRVTVIENNGTFTLTPSTAYGFTSLVFEAVNDLVTLLYVDDTVGWIIISQESVQTE